MFIEDLFLINFIVDLLLLIIVNKVLYKHSKKRYLLLGGLLGGLFSILLYNYDYFLLKILSSLIICFFSFGFHSKQEFLKTSLCFYLASFSLAGITEAIISFFGITEFPYMLFSVSTGLCFLILSYISKAQKTAQKQEIEEVEINLFDKKKKIRALRDTGNLTGAIITEYHAIKEILPKEFCENYEKDDEYYSLIGKYKFDIIPIQTITGTELLIALPMGDKKIAIARRKLSGGGRFQAII